MKNTTLVKDKSIKTQRWLILALTATLKKESL